MSGTLTFVIIPAQVLKMLVIFDDYDDKDDEVDIDYGGDNYKEL